MRTYVYDGSFKGFLCAAHLCLKNKEEAVITTSANKATDLFWEEIKVKTSTADAESCQEFIKNRISPQAWRKIFYVFWAGVPDREDKIMDFLRRGLVVGRAIDRLLLAPEVAVIDDIVFKVRREAERLRGLARFEELANGILLARLAPDHNILMLLVPHFVDRLGSVSWVIHDVLRHQAVIYDTHHWRLVHCDEKKEAALSPNEKNCQDLWREYFRTIAIPSRANPKLQRQFLPERYWKYLVEMNDVVR